MPAADPLEHPRKLVEPHESVEEKMSLQNSFSISKAFISSSEISNPPIFAFSTILSFFTLFGNGTYPCWIDHRTISCAVVHPYFSAIITNVGFVIRNALARGAYASTVIPLFLQNVTRSGRVLKGWTSIWFTDGGYRRSLLPRSSFNCDKFSTSSEISETRGRRC